MIFTSRVYLFICFFSILTYDASHYKHVACLFSACLHSIHLCRLNLNLTSPLKHTSVYSHTLKHLPPVLASLGKLIKFIIFPAFIENTILSKSEIHL